jgi:hypothetical protein
MALDARIALPHAAFHKNPISHCSHEGGEVKALHTPRTSFYKMLPTKKKIKITNYLVS